MKLRILRLLVCLSCTVCASAHGADQAVHLPAAVVAAKISLDAWRKLQSGELRDLIVLLDDRAIQAEAQDNRRRRGLGTEDAAVLGLKALRYRQLKERLWSTLDTAEVEVLRDYRQLPMAFLRLRDFAALHRLLSREEVLAVYPDERLERHLAESLPLLGQPQTASIIGHSGAGSMVAILDTGVDYTRSAFGSCTSPGVPSGTCKVIHAEDIAPDDGSRDDNGHGSNVAAIALGVAPDTRIVALDVFTGATASSTDVIAGIDRVIQLKGAPTQYNIVALNLSLGSSTKPTLLQCTLLNPYRSPILNAKAAGVLSVASSGNSAWADAIATPACTPEAISVGAVYDANVGARSWGGDANCTDSATAADKIVCFSNSASNLKMLAPGALIAAAGATYSGTSQAAPHVAGAIGVLQAAFPGDTPDQLQTRLIDSGKAITDVRNGIVKPRVDLLAAQGAPANNDFAAASTLNTDSGAIDAWNFNAGKEAGEPGHAGDNGGRSVWWQWTAPAAGTFTLDTHGSGFDTLLGVYVGGSVATLATVIANDDDGAAGGVSGLSFHTDAGILYRLAVDGKAAASGGIALNWAFAADPPPSADLELALADAPDPIAPGGVLTYTLTVTNHGPDSAAGVTVNQTLPLGTVFVSAAADCNHAAGSVICSLGDLPAGQQASRAVLVGVAAPGVIDSQASVSGASADGNPANDSATATTTVSASGGDGDGGDVPLPAWVAWLLGAGLLSAMGGRGLCRKPRSS